MTLLHHEYGNKTMYGITRHAEWYLVIGFHLFVIASSLIGDSIILLASVKYRVFKLHKVITVIIEHIAICDLMVLSTLSGRRGVAEEKSTISEDEEIQGSQL